MQVSPRFPVAAQFAGFRLDLRAGELQAEGGKLVRLPEQPLRILKTLLERSGEVVTREELQKRLWPNDTIVEFEHSISAAMNRLRQALGDSAEDPRFIETLARRGYRFMVPVQFEEMPVSPSVPSEVPASSEAQIGRSVTHYQVLEKLGGGGMGVVYKAKDTRLNRAVALKFLPTEMANDAAALERFRREAQAASALNHPNICTIYDVGEMPLGIGEGNESHRFIAMEFLDGQTLERRISGKPLPVMETLELGIEIADALSAAHAEGIIHRDIKSANVFVTKRGSAKVLDFGLAKLTAEGATEHHSNLSAMPAQSGPGGITVLGKAMGTLTYMSPEQVRGEALDARADLFSFGVALYQMATGILPFRGDDPEVIREAILNRAPEAPKRWNPSLPVRLEEIILKALEKDRRFRYQFAAEIRTDLQRLKREIGSEQLGLVANVATKVSVPAKKNWTRGRKWMLAGGVAFGFTVFTFLLARGPSPESEQLLRAEAREAEAKEKAELSPTRAEAKPNPTKPLKSFASQVVPKASTDPIPAHDETAKPNPPKLLAGKRAVGVDLSHVYNATGFYTEGAEFDSRASLDQVGYAFPAEMLDATKVWDGVTFKLGPANAPDAVTSRTIALPPGKFDELRMLALGVNGDQESQTFTVMYSDGSSADFSQSVSDWYTARNFGGESEVASTPYRIGSRGGRDDRTFHVYGYSFQLDGKKTALSFTLPTNRHVLVFGVTLVRGLSHEAVSVQQGGTPSVLSHKSVRPGKYAEKRQHQNVNANIAGTDVRTDVMVTMDVRLKYALDAKRR
ncbi:MAG TPA: protein kinase [Candidatus Dormibacteraeota bacterium]|jgi:serine/threonine protein kinase|nr:protein kinase [Candidatus Dormibacteraeota bacterium]